MDHLTTMGSFFLEVLPLIPDDSLWLAKSTNKISKTRFWRQLHHILGLITLPYGIKQLIKSILPIVSTDAHESYEELKIIPWCSSRVLDHCFRPYTPALRETLVLQLLPFINKPMNWTYPPLMKIPMMMFRLLQFITMVMSMISMYYLPWMDKPFIVY